ncbi:MAG: transcriptional repressor [Hydrotalea sp.]|nr:transcriptional repressor [Hydrotalea sp.]
MAASIIATFLSTKKTAQNAVKSVRSPHAPWENALGAMTLPPELMVIFGGNKHQLTAVKRRGVIAALKKLKHLAGTGIFPQQLLARATQGTDGGADSDAHAAGVNGTTAPDDILSDVALSGMLKDRKITPTAPRLLMMKLLFQRKTHQHLTAEEIFAKLKGKKKPSISLASIYNSLNLFVEHGLLARHHFSMQLWDEKKRGAIFYDTNIMPHHHVVDKSSGKIYDLPLDIIPMQDAVEMASQRMKKDNAIPQNLWRAQGVKKNIFVMPMVFVLE